MGRPFIWGHANVLVVHPKPLALGSLEHFGAFGEFSSSLCYVEHDKEFDESQVSAPSTVTLVSEGSGSSC